MAGLAASGSNPDVDFLYDINGLGHDAPHWLARAVEFAGLWGLPAVMALLVLGCWWTQRRAAATPEAAATSAAAVLWSLIGAGVAVLVNVPIRDFVGRPRPASTHDGVHVLAGGQGGYSFVSTHATLTMAMAAGLFVAHRRFGLAGIVVALADGFCQVFLGVHYPTDVIGGLALGTAVALLGAPLAAAALTPLTRALGRSPRLSRLTTSRERGPSSSPATGRGEPAERPAPAPCDPDRDQSGPRESDLAA
ncbi:phosphatase PAP2 family protein [Streptomyces sp. NPDC050560]|uniref:phosphatase PAP2 family protein n=1 Tax=Streptomyces sp. NPDC050560 TaxID=3365630 RepID=UPI00378D9243